MTVAIDTRVNPPISSDPLEQAIGYHRFLRATLVRKCLALSEEQLRSTPLPSGLSLLAILKHSVNVERWWIAKTIGNLPMAFDWDGDGSAFDLLPGESFRSIRSAYDFEAGRSAQVLTGIQWADVRYPDLRRILMDGEAGVTGARWEDVPIEAPLESIARNVGWIMLHLIEEVGRHCGHVDLIREAIDGQTGE